MKKGILTIAVMIVSTFALQAAVFPTIGGPGLIHLQSAKTGSQFGARNLNMMSNYGNQYHYSLPGNNNSFNDLWSHVLLNYAPSYNFSIMLQGLAHGEQWKVTTPAPDTTDTIAPASIDKTLGCPGDFTVAFKYSLPLGGGKADLAFMPLITIPMDKDKYQDGPSQTGKLDFGGKVLTDIALGNASTLLLNAGFMTRGEQRPQVPLGLGLNFDINPKFSTFVETSAELRIGQKKDSLPDSLIKSGRGFDRTEARITPGIRYIPFPGMGINLAADIGLTKAAAPWQAILGFDFPAAVGLIKAAILPATIAGIIKNIKNNQPLKGMISFPGTDIPGIVSETNGNYRASLKPGTYSIKVMANGFRTVERKIELKSGESQAWDLTLKPKEGIIKGAVTDALTGKPVPSSVTVGTENYPVEQASGAFSLTLAAPKKYQLEVKVEGYQAYQTTVSLNDKDNILQDFVLQPIVKAVPVTPEISVKLGTKTTAKIKTPKIPAAPKAPGLTPDQVSALYKTGVKQYMGEEYDKAVKTFQSVIKADPGNSKAKDYLKKSQERLKKIRG